nr:DUF3276 family protein [Lunatimonas salinarum]
MIKKSRKVEDNKDYDRDEIFSKKVKAGKRTYFFDVKSTRSNDYYLTITESKRKMREESFFYEKHKIFLYKEDFNKFLEALQRTVDHVKNDLMPEVDFTQFDLGSDSSDDDSDSFKDDLKWD